MPKVTVIMPSLNVVKYIRTCMESVLAQTLQDIEILAIDAGSDDGTLEILQEYAEADQRVKVIHSDRKSYGHQLNMGISLARGEYVGVVETDDRIVPDMLKVLYEKAVETGADYVKGCARSFMEITREIVVSNRIMCTSSVEEMDKQVNLKQHPKLFVTDRFLWMGIYRYDFIKTIKLNETLGAAFQDIGFMFQVICNADMAVYLDKDVYFYRQDNTGASSHDKRGFRYLVEEYAYVNQFLKGKGKEWYQVYYEKMLSQCLGRFQMMAISGTFWEEAISDMEILRKRLLQAVENNFLLPSDLDSQTQRLLELFLEGSNNIYTYYMREIQKKADSVCEIIRMVNRQQVIVFGCGGVGKFFHALLEDNCPGLVVTYCDNNEALHNLKVQGIPVLSPKQAVQEYPNAYYVITSRRYSSEIREQILRLGIKGSQIFEYTYGIDMMLISLKGYIARILNERRSVD